MITIFERYIISNSLVMRMGRAFTSFFLFLHRFKEMREMHGSSSRDDRHKREQLRQEKEMAKFAQMADAHKQQQQQQKDESENSDLALKKNVLADQDQRKVLKFGFSSKLGASKGSGMSAAKKAKTPIALVFGNDSDEE
ncbi:hypothetical protein LXL04_037253 [Taraxacum kok-saghyz]